MQLEKTYLIYRYISPSGKSYIGQTCNLKRRESEHKKMRSRCVCFIDAIKKYGFENFIREIIIDNLTIDDANIMEIFYIEKFNTLSPTGYNLTTGGLNYTVSEETRKRHSESNSGEKHWAFGTNLSEETKQKISESLSGENHPNWGKFGEDNPLFGIPRPEEVRKKISEANTGKIVSEEHRKKISEARIGKFGGENHSMYGKCHTEESKKLMSESQSGEKSHSYGKFGENAIASKKYIITFPDEHEEIILGMAEFCRHHNLDPSAMSAVAKGKVNHHKGFKCRYFI